MADGHTMSTSHVVYLALEPDSAEATLLQATKTMEPNRLYGLSGYNLLLLLPVGMIRTEEAGENEVLP